MKVVEIFKSIEGEGLRTGAPVTFIRLHGCNLRCEYCDTKYSYGDSPYKEMTIDEIINTVKRLGLIRVTLTGGEPLMNKEALLLVTTLVQEGFHVNVETNGSISLYDYYVYRNSLKYRLASGSLMFTVDYKSISSGMNKHNNLNNFNYISMQENDVYKFVVGSSEDLEDMKKVVEFFHLPEKAVIYVSPVFGQIEAKDIVKYVLENNLEDVVIQVQLHKIIWDPDQRGV